MYTIFSLIGIISLIAIGYLLSSSKKDISWRSVSLAFAIQLGIAFFVLYVPIGVKVLSYISGGVEALLDSLKEGVAFLFGYQLAVVGGKTQALPVGFVFAFNVLPMIIAIGSFISVLYYLGAMQWLIRSIGGALNKLLGTTPNESLVASANIFLSFSESPMVVKPYLRYMSESEIFTVMVCGLASVAGTVMAGYISMGVDPSYLITAAFMSAPGGLLMSKLFLPESKENLKKRVRVELNDEEKAEIEKNKDANLLDAIMSGATTGLKIAVSIGAMLIAFVGLVAIIDMFLSTIGGWFDIELSLVVILGYVFSPVALLIGVSPNEMHQVGALIGQKFILNEFVAFDNLVGKKEILIDGVNQTVALADKLSPKSLAIATFAICGFANIGSVAGIVGALNTLAPSRKLTYLKIAPRALLAATMTNLMSGAIAGLIIGLQS